MQFLKKYGLQYNAKHFKNKNGDDNSNDLDFFYNRFR